MSGFKLTNEKQLYCLQTTLFSPNHFCFLLTTFVFSWTGKWVFQSRRKQKWLGENKVRGFQQALFTFLLNFFSGDVIGKSRKKPTNDIVTNWARWYVFAVLVIVENRFKILSMTESDNWDWDWYLPSFEMIFLALYEDFGKHFSCSTFQLSQWRHLLTI